MVRALPDSHVYRSQTRISSAGRLAPVTLESTVRLLENFLSGSRDAVVMEAGAAVFDLATPKYSISAELGKCLLHLWSAEAT